jgi:2'-5' RNA ligase
MRTFIAVEIPKEIRKSIHARIQTFNALALPVKWVSFDNLHITLKFLGEIAEERKNEIGPLLQGVADRYGSFSITLRQYGCFPNARRPRVIWIGVNQGSQFLSNLAHDVDDALTGCGFVPEEHFHPHLTIGRVKRPCSIDNILNQEYISEPFIVTTLVLFKSTLTPRGSVYQALATYQFGVTPQQELR